MHHLPSTLHPTPQETAPTDLAGGLLGAYFPGYLLARFSAWCQASGHHPSLSLFLHFLTTHELITPTTIRHFTVLHHVEALVATGAEPNKTIAVFSTAEYFSLAESTVWNILKEHKGKFGG